MARIKEFGDASVPLDVHLVIYADDAPELENTLHRAFHFRWVNRVNAWKELFQAGIAEIIDAASEQVRQVEFARDEAPAS